MTEALTKEIEKAQEKLRTIDGSIQSLGVRNAARYGYNNNGSNGAGGGIGIQRRLSAEGAGRFPRADDRRLGGLTVTSDVSSGFGRRRIEMGGDRDVNLNRTFPGKRRMQDDEDEDDFDHRPKKTLQSQVVMPAIETKSRKAKLEELSNNEKKETKTRNRRLFSNLLQGTLTRFEKEEKKAKDVEEIQENKRREVEKRLEESKDEDRKKMAAERQELLNKRRDQEKELHALQRKKALIQYAEAKQEHYKLLSNFIQTQAKPTLFFAPAKHTMRSLELLKASQKGIQALMDLRQKELEKDLEHGQQDDEEESVEALRSFVATNENKKRERVHDSDDEKEQDKEEDEEPTPKKRQEDEPAEPEVHIEMEEEREAKQDEEDEEAILVE